MSLLCGFDPWPQNITCLRNGHQKKKRERERLRKDPEAGEGIREGEGKCRNQRAGLWGEPAKKGVTTQKEEA